MKNEADSLLKTVLPRSVGFHLKRMRFSPTFPYSIFLNFPYYPLLFTIFPYDPYKKSKIEKLFYCLEKLEET